MKQTVTFLRTSGCFLLLTVMRCATAHNGRFQSVDVSSDPSGAVVQLVCSGQRPLIAETPARIAVPRRADPCYVSLTRTGYREERIPLARLTSKWVWMNAAAIPVGTVAHASTGLYTNGNQILLDGFLGGAAVTTAGILIDRATGGAFMHAPNEIRAVLTPDSSTEVKPSQSQGARATAMPQ